MNIFNSNMKDSFSAKWILKPCPLSQKLPSPFGKKDGGKRGGVEFRKKELLTVLQNCCRKEPHQWTSRHKSFCHGDFLIASAPQGSLQVRLLHTYYEQHPKLNNIQKFRDQGHALLRTSSEGQVSYATNADTLDSHLHSHRACTFQILREVSVLRVYGTHRACNNFPTSHITSYSIIISATSILRFFL